MKLQIIKLMICMSIGSCAPLFSSAQNVKSEIDEKIKAQIEMQKIAKEGKQKAKYAHALNAIKKEDEDCVSFWMTRGGIKPQVILNMSIFEAYNSRMALLAIRSGASTSVEATIDHVLHKLAHVQPIDSILIEPILVSAELENEHEQKTALEEAVLANNIFLAKRLLVLGANPFCRYPIADRVMRCILEKAQNKDFSFVLAHEKKQFDLLKKSREFQQKKIESKS